MRRFDSVSDDAQGSEPNMKSIKLKKSVVGCSVLLLIGLMVEKLSLKTRSHSYTTVKAKPIRRAIEEIRSNLEDELGHLSESYLQAWKKKIYSQVVSALREAMGDGELDVNIIARAVKKCFGAYS